MTQRSNLHWGVENWYGQSNNLSYTYQNNRITNSGWVYDADGRVLQSAAPDDSNTSVYDARGFLIYHHFSHPNGVDGDIITSRYYDGDGREVKRAKQSYDANNYSWVNNIPEYYIRSSVLGGERLTELDHTGRKVKTNVIAAGRRSRRSRSIRITARRLRRSRGTTRTRVA